MALLDLQGMELPEERSKAPAGSRASKGCTVGGGGGGGGGSRLSLLLC
jgi:hypothetical protein